MSSALIADARGKVLRVVHCDDDRYSFAHHVQDGETLVLLDENITSLDDLARVVRQYEWQP